LSDKLGRKRLLILSGFLFTVSAIWTALSGGFLSFNIARFLGGVGIGLASNLSPMYIAEISPTEMRGRFVSINQLTIVIGILAAQLTNWCIAENVPEGTTVEMIRRSWNGLYGWRWMFGAETVPAFLFFWLMFFVPESPRWLVKNGRDEQAARILTSVGGEDYARYEVADIKDTIAGEEVARVHFGDLFEPKLQRIVALGVFLAVFQQWCGINVIFNYAQEVFQAAGYEVGELMIGIVITGVVNLLFTFIAIFTVDRFGRRPLMLIGAAGLAGIYAVLGTGYYLQSTGIHMLLLVISAIACYAMSLAPITWVVISEVFPNRIRGAAMSVAVLSLWVGCAALTFSFPVLNRALGPHGAFWLYGAICVLGFWIILLRLPETKGKSLEDIERELVD
jgi:SP family sugar porter-like MFS transporter